MKKAEGEGEADKDMAGGAGAVEAEGMETLEMLVEEGAGGEARNGLHAVLCFRFCRRTRSLRGVEREEVDEAVVEVMLEAEGAQPRLMQGQCDHP